MKIHDLREVNQQYRTIYLDPPWPYDHRPLGRRDLDDIYDGGVMDLDDICRLPVPQLCHADGFVVYLWCTWPKIRDGYHQRVFDAWGLTWRSELIWDKVGMGMGRWLRKQTELLLVAGPKDRAPLKPLRRNQRDLVSVPKMRKHSAKPREVRKIVETLSPGPRIELFARVHAPGWDVWGREAPEEVQDL
jgi:N6-adenosine-specific RNA methylase IME4